MKQIDKISIIIPVYNVDKYLCECLNSIRKQNFKNYEVILINDGSTDNSLGICKKICEMDGRFKLINQQNLGVSHARNIGITESTGNILIFLDSDDFLEPNAIDDIYRSLKDNDLVCFGYNRVFKNKIKKSEPNYSNNKEQIIDNIFYGDSIGGYLWNKAFRKAIIINNNIKFNENIHFCEDLLFVSQYIKYCNKFLCISNSLYNYRMRSSSATFNFYNKKNLSILNAYELLINVNKENKPVYFEFCYRYIYNYYYLKSLIKKYNFNINYLILKQEKKVLSTKSFHDKIKFYFVKFMPNIFICLKRYKIKKSNLFE